MEHASGDSMSSPTAERITALQDHARLDTAANDRFSDITQLAAAYFQMPVARVLLVETDPQCPGPPPHVTPRDRAVCDHAVLMGPNAVLIIEDAAQDSRFCRDLPMIGTQPIRFYAGAVLTTSDGLMLGTLCVLDTKPRPRPSDVDLQWLRALAKMVVDQIELSAARGILEERQRLLKSAEAMSGVGHWRFDLASQRVTWSDEVFRIHGLPLSANVPAYEEIQQLYHEDDRATLTGLVDRAAETGEGFEFQLRIRRPDGSIRYTIAKAECVLTPAGATMSIFGVFQDVTRQHLAAATLAESERHCRMLADNVRDIIAVYDANGVFRYVSPSITSLLGYAPEEMLGKMPYLFMHADDHARVAREFNAAANAPVDVTVEYRALAKNGDVRWLEAKPRFHRDAAGTLVEISDSVRDVTDRRLREAALQQARLDAENASAAKATFLANMSHEIRTPMNAVFGFTELLARMELTTEQRTYLQLIADSGRTMMRLLNDILDMSKIDSGRMQVTAEPVHLGQKLHTCAQLMEPIARSKAVDLTIALDPALPEYVVGDPLRIRQILLNLIGNAVKFTDHGAVHVHARAAHGLLLIEVEDTGIGIPPDRLDIIFQQFAQADVSVARRYGGTGLGLSISAELARLMGGSIDVVSAVGVGTTFTLRIPLVEADTPIRTDPFAEPCTLPSDPPRTTPLRVLIAEDHAVNRALISAMADAAGFTYRLATGGAEAVAMVQAAAAANAPFDLVLMDMQMPGVDGLTATRRIRALGFTAERLPIVALTANAYAEDKAACIAAGMQAHLAKPLRLRDLEALAVRFSANQPLRHDHAAPAPDCGTTNDVAALYQKGKATTLAAVSASVGRPSIDAQHVRELTAMLHDLAGTAGFFGEAPLGDAASVLEHDLKRAPAGEWSRVLQAGCERLVHAT